MPPDSALDAWADTLGRYAPLALAGVLFVALTGVWLGWLAFERLSRAIAGWRASRRPAVDHTPSAVGYLAAHLVIGLGLAWVGVHGFAELTETLGTQDALARFDAALAQSLHAHATPLGLWSFRAVAWLGGLPVMAALALAVSAWLWRRGQFIRLLGWIAALAGDGVLNTVLKLNFQRVRPSAAWPNPFVVEPGWSFPSGHAMGSLVAYGMLAYLIVTNEVSASRGWRLGTVAGALALILAIGFSRLYLTVHFFSDVVAGYAAGGAWLVICVTGTELARRGRGRRPGAAAPVATTKTAHAGRG